LYFKDNIERFVREILHKNHLFLQIRLQKLGTLLFIIKFDGYIVGKSNNQAGLGMSVQTKITNFKPLNTGKNEPHQNELEKAIYQSNFIRKHFDFYQWQEQYVNKFIPHNVLIAAWGDFDKGSLQFDICSSIPEIHHQQVISGCNEVSPLMSALFKKWEDNDDKWFFHEEFKIWDLGIEFLPSDKIMNELLAMRTVLVYGFRDKRSNTNVLYAFLNSHLMCETQTSTLSAIMPHLDAALRGVDCLPESKKSKADARPVMWMISERETSVLNLVVKGQTNIEVAKELFISINTVKNHLKNIYKKMHVSSRTEAVSKYLQASKSNENVVVNDHNIHHLSINIK